MNLNELGQTTVEPYDADIDRQQKLPQIAEDLGCELLWADDMTLQLDLDGLGSLERFRVLYNLAHETGLLVGDLLVNQWRSKSGKGWHVVIKLARATPPEERILLQVMLGSDQAREMLNYTRHPKTICLFKPKEAK